MPLAENTTQFEGASDRQERDIVIGLDFGTSCTKVVVQDPVLRTAFAVQFAKRGHPNNAYLLPSKLGLDANGQFQLSGFNRGGIRGFKRPLMKTPNKSKALGSSWRIKTNALELASAYIGLVLRDVRMSFLTNFYDVYGKNRIRWHLNLGIPARNYDEKNIKQAFLSTARAAWWLSILEDPITINSTKEAVSRAKGEDFEPGIHRDNIQVVPEVAAEVAGYARSPLRRMGLHMIVDVGATTMDVATFRLDAPEEEFRYVFLCAEVSEYACYHLHLLRCEQVKKYFDKWVSNLAKIDDLRAAIPQTHQDYTPPPIHLSDIDDQFAQKALVAITRVLVKTYAKRDPNAVEWKTGVPLFICGGGSYLSLFKEELIKSAENRLKNYNWKGFRPLELPKPNELKADGLDPRQYHRLAVAYGLSFLFEEIGHIIPPSDLEDLPKEEKRRELEEKYISKDMV